MESLTPALLPDPVECLPCDASAPPPAAVVPSNGAGIFVPPETFIQSQSAPRLLDFESSKRTSVASPLPMLLPAQPRPTGLLLPVSATLRPSFAPPMERVAALQDDISSQRRPASLPSALGTPVLLPAAQMSPAKTPQHFHEIASSISNLPAEVGFSSRDVVQCVDLVVASMKGLFSIHFIILADSIVLATRSSTKGLVYLGFLELCYSDISAVPLSIAESTLVADGKPIPLGKYRSWLRLRYHQWSEFFISSAKESELAELKSLLRGLIDKVPTLSYSTINASPKPPPCAGHTFVCPMTCSIHLLSSCLTLQSHGNVATAVWTRLVVPGLPVLFRHSAVTINGLIYVFGGLFNSKPQNKLYCIDPVVQTCKEIPTSRGPVARSQHSVAEISNKFVIFGGLDEKGFFLNDLWTYDPAGSSWSEIRVSGAPCARAGAAIVVTSSSILIWGGYGTVDFPPNLHVLQLASSMWKLEPGCGVIPSRRHAACFSKIDSNLILYGGELSPSGDLVGDLFTLGLQKFRWRRCANSAPFPLRSEAASAIFVSPKDLQPMLLVVGGKCDPKDPRVVCDDGIMIPIGKSLDVEDKWEPNFSDINKKLLPYNFASSRCLVVAGSAKAQLKKSSRASLPPSPKPSSIDQTPTSASAKVAPLQTIADALKEKRTRSASPSESGGAGCGISAEGKMKETKSSTVSVGLISSASASKEDSQPMPAVRKVSSPAARSHSAPQIPPASNPPPNVRSSTPPSRSTEEKPTKIPDGIKPVIPAVIPVVRAPAAPKLSTSSPSVGVRSPSLSSNPSTPSSSPQPLASPASLPHEPARPPQSAARANSPAPARASVGALPASDPSRSEVHVKVTAYTLERDKRELKLPFACSFCFLTSTHILFGDDEFSILQHPATLIDRSAITLVGLQPNGGAELHAKSFRLKPNAANETFFKFYCSVRRKLMQRIIDGGGSIIIPAVGSSARPIVLHKKRLFMYDSSQKQMREIKHKQVRAIFLRSRRVGLELPTKAGGFLVCDCENALFVAATLRDFYKVSFTSLSSAPAKAVKSSTQVSPPDAASAESAFEEQRYQDHSRHVLNARVRQYYEDIKTRHEQKNGPQIGAKGQTTNNQAILTAISSRDITIIHQLGRGSGGVVVSMAKWRQKYVAIKTVSAVTPADVEALYAEANLNALIPIHKNVLRTFGLVCDGQQYSIVMELAPRGSLQQALELNRSQARCFNFFSQLKLLRGVLRGMSVIAKSGIVHRDLAARNVLLANSGLEPKIADFGFSRNIGSQKEGQTQSDLGPIRWMAPESLLERKFSAKSDVWSFGILAIEIMSNGQLPYFWEQDIISVALGIREGRLNPLSRTSPSWSKYIIELITPCFNMDPSKRPTFEQLAEQIDRDFDSSFDDEDDDNEGKEESESEYFVGVGNEEIKPSVQLVSEKSGQVWQKPIQLMNIAEIKLIKQLGKGEYGDVYLASWKQELVAVKRIRDDTSPITLSAFKSEAMLMSNMTFHRNVIKTKAYCLEPGHLCLVTELASNGDLETFLEKISKGVEPPMDPMMIYYIAISVAEGMAFLHSQHIIHRDLAARNILLQEDWTPKVSDFGFARALGDSDDSGRTSSDLGPIRWMAPECLSRQYSSKSDVWSFGCVLIELFTRRRPYPEYELLHVGSLVRDGRLSPKVWVERTKLNLPSWAADIIAECSEFNPDNRPSFATIVATLAARFGEVEILSNVQHVNRVAKDLLL